MSDRDSDSVRMSIVSEAAQFLARLVNLHIYPREYNRVHYEGGKRFEVIVKEHVTKDDTKPLEEQ